MVSIISGAAIALSTCVCMYYDSHIPGLEPPSPCSSPLSCRLYQLRYDTTATVSQSAYSSLLPLGHVTMVTSLLATIWQRSMELLVSL